MSLGISLHKLGQLDDAVASFRRALALDADFEVGHYNLAVTLGELGQFDEAVASYRQVLKINPGHAEAHVNLGNALKNLGQLDGAVASYRRALEIASDHAAAHSNLGTALQALGQLDDAVTSYRRALTIKPDLAEAHLGLGTALQALGQLEDAVRSYRRALECNPQFAEAQYTLGNALRALGRLHEALASYRQALRIKSDFAMAHCALGSVLNEVGQPAEAIGHYRRALEIKPDFAEAHVGLGIVLTAIGQLDDAVSCHRRALAINPDLAEAHNDLGNCLRDLGQFDEAIAHYRRAMEIRHDFWLAHSNLLFAMNYLANNDASEYLEEARNFGRNLDASVSTRFAGWSSPLRPERLRIGLVSGDFRSHPVGYFLEALLREHDRTRIEFFAYPTNRLTDKFTDVLRSHFSAWKPLAGRSDEAAAKLIHADGVHVLLDLAGHTAHNRLPVFGHVPAPIQASWLGYFATTGVTQMDYLIGDRHVMPAGEESHFTERVWRLPESYLCFTPPAFAPDVGPLPALSTGSVTFGCFNNLSKMNDRRGRALVPSAPRGAGIAAVSQNQHSSATRRSGQRRCGDSPRPESSPIGSCWRDKPQGPNISPPMIASTSRWILFLTLGALRPSKATGWECPPLRGAATGSCPTRGKALRTISGFPIGSPSTTMTMWPRPWRFRRT